MLIGSDVSSHSIGIFDFGTLLNVGVNEVDEGGNSAGCFFKYPFIDPIFDQVTSRRDAIQIEASENRFNLTINSIKPDI